MAALWGVCVDHFRPSVNGFGAPVVVAAGGLVVMIGPVIIGRAVAGPEWFGMTKGRLVSP
jgi:hypothetical protein